MKRILSLLLVLSLLFSSAMAWGDVVDNADILTDDQEAQITARINEIIGTVHLKEGGRAFLVGLGHAVSRS